MTELAFVLAIPLLSALLLALFGHHRGAPEINSAGSLATLVAAAALTVRVIGEGPLVLFDEQFFVDPLNVFLIALTALVGFTTSLFSRPYMRVEHDHGRLSVGRLRLYHSMFQMFMCTMLVALSTNNLGILWVAMEAATLTTVLLVALYRTPASLEAAWKYFILCGVGIAQALFGTILLFFAAEKLLGAEGGALLWTELNHVKGQLEPTVLSIAFVFLLVGYGTKVGLVPMHQWLPDAHSEGPTPMSAVLSGLLLNVALYAVVRLKMLVDGSLAATATPQLAGYLLMGFGLVSFLTAGLFLHRQRDIKRMFSYSSIEHMGLMTFAFGIGGPLATFGALLHMLVHSFTKSAIFVTVGHAAHIAGTQSIDHIRGLIRTQPAVGWSLLIGVAAIAGFPPFGVFTSEFLLLTATMQSQPWLTVALLTGLAVAFAGLFRHIHPMVYGAAPEGQQPVQANLLPVAVHLGLVLWLGLSIPAFLARWLDLATELITGTRLL